MGFLPSIPLSAQTVLLLIASNVFMTVAWYGHLKSLAIVPFSTVYLRQPFKWDYVWAGLCMLAAVYFIFRGG